MEEDYKNSIDNNENNSPLRSDIVNSEENNSISNDISYYTQLLQNFETNSDPVEIIQHLMTLSTNKIISDLSKFQDFPLDSFLHLLFTLYEHCSNNLECDHLLDITISIFSIQSQTFPEEVLEFAFEFACKNIDSIQFKRFITLLSYLCSYSDVITQKSLEAFNFEDLAQFVANKDCSTIASIIFYFSKAINFFDENLFVQIYDFLSDSLDINDLRLDKVILNYISSTLIDQDYAQFLIGHPIIDKIVNLLSQEIIDTLNAISGILLQILQFTNLPNVVIESLLGSIARMETADSTMNDFFINVTEIFSKIVNIEEYRPDILKNLIILLQDGSFQVRESALKVLCEFLKILKENELNLVLEMRVIYLLDDFIDESNPDNCIFICESLIQIINVANTLNMKNTIIELMSDFEMIDKLVDLTDDENEKLSLLAKEVLIDTGIEFTND
ncbi:hypothetical protein TVAG_001550 [Trichomonas vaginalis G3]|uniref:Uncharacterized protein n=1 Tax=Trichomonas vaginalis (strain ATCC PRA-98 / G3) TaxID=412133 RepID=A2FLI8_TRIV3|nr:armadillo (ARM) repeat-containing protein family [Trichomonas vaginalis G3]EAX94238.1 hypothetical protein TVAG_001550 [Trichomonas vaginalis G3]KAI5503597.1 armadillo (ARM) repeat-containing protein family [Trichomonas vaginalis G3]|eukprot:XP_001307168.1 hypothetical protein [Trichomonas vaginalis G3]